MTPQTAASSSCRGLSRGASTARALFIPINGASAGDGTSSGKTEETCGGGFIGRVLQHTPAKADRISVGAGAYRGPTHHDVRPAGLKHPRSRGARRQFNAAHRLPNEYAADSNVCDRLSSSFASMARTAMRAHSWISFSFVMQPVSFFARAKSFPTVHKTILN